MEIRQTAKSYNNGIYIGLSLFLILLSYTMARVPRIASGAIIMILAGIFPVIGAILSTLPSAVLGGCTIMMFGTIVASGAQMISKCGFSQRNITIVALSLAVGLGFTQKPMLFDIFPQIIRTVFAENCVAVVFFMAIILNLLLPKNMENDVETNKVN